MPPRWAVDLNQKLQFLVAPLSSVHGKAEADILRINRAWDPFDKLSEECWFMVLVVPLRHQTFCRSEWVLSTEDAHRGAIDLVESIQMVGNDFEAIRSRMSLLGHDSRAIEYESAFAP